MSIVHGLSVKCHHDDSGVYNTMKGNVIPDISVWLLSLTLSGDENRIIGNGKIDQTMTRIMTNDLLVD